MRPVAVGDERRGHGVLVFCSEQWGRGGRGGAPWRARGGVPGVLSFLAGAPLGAAAAGERRGAGVWPGLAARDGKKYTTRVQSGAWEDRLSLSAPAGGWRALLVCLTGASAFFCRSCRSAVRRPLPRRPRRASTPQAACGVSLVLPTKGAVKNQGLSAPGAGPSTPKGRPGPC